MKKEVSQVTETQEKEVEDYISSISLAHENMTKGIVVCEEKLKKLMEIDKKESELLIKYTEALRSEVTTIISELVRF